jgi:hypothetical protein
MGQECPYKRGVIGRRPTHLRRFVLNGSGGLENGHQPVEGTLVCGLRVRQGGVVGMADVLPLVDLVQCQRIGWVTTRMTIGCTNTHTFSESEVTCLR